MSGLLEKAPTVEDPYDPIRRSQLAPRKLAVSNAAKRVYISFHDIVERDMAGELKELRAFANKAPEHLLRLAGILTLVDNPEAPEIAEHHAVAARDLVAYFLSESYRLNERARQDPDLRLAERLLDWLQHLGRPVSLVEIYQCGPNPLRDAKCARHIARIIEEHGHIESVTDILYRGQFRSEGWRLTA